MKPVGEICLYGTSAASGWLAKVHKTGELLGEGEALEGRSYTAALWLAAMALEEKTGYDPKATVEVFAAGGARMAVANLHSPGYYGDLKWGAAKVYEISAEALMAAGEVYTVSKDANGKYTFSKEKG